MIHRMRLPALASCVVLCAALPATARAGSIVYPLEGIDLEPDELASVQAMVVKTIQAKARKGGVLAPANQFQFVAKKSCGDHPEVKCLKGLVRGSNLVIYGAAKQAGSTANVELAIVDATGKVVGKTHFVLDLVFLDYTPAVRAILALDRNLNEVTDSQAVAATDVPAAPVKRDSTTTATAAPAKPAPAPAPAPAPKREEAAAVPAQAIEAQAQPLVTGMWKRTAGPVLTATGGALLLGGLVVSILDRQLYSSLNQKFNDGTLDPSDSASYSRVNAYNATADALFAAGAVAAGTGLVFWITAPPAAAAGNGGGVRAGVSGHF